MTNKTLFTLAIVLTGCATGNYAPSTVLLPPHLKKFAVEPFKNETQYFGLEEKLWLRTTEEFVRDGRLTYVSNVNEADGVIEGKITRYILEPVSYDANHVIQEYKLWVLIDLKLIDRVNNAVVWEEPRLEQSHRYFTSAQPGGLTEEEGREILWDNFARDIVRRTIEGFGSVTGASPRAAPSQPGPTPY